MDDPFHQIDADINHFELYPSINENSAKQYYTTEEFNLKFPSNNKKDLSIFHINIRSLNKNGDELIAYLSLLKRDFDIICLTETWISELPVIDDIFPSYKSYHSIRKGKNGGGCAIYINSKYPTSIIPDITVNESYIETVFAKITGKLVGHI